MRPLSASVAGRQFAAGIAAARAAAETQPPYTGRRRPQVPAFRAVKHWKQSTRWGGAPKQRNLPEQAL